VTIASGTRLGPYEILSPLGAGGMGEVYRAKDTKLGRDVAIKVLPEEFLEGEDRKARFEQEARLLAALNHPGIAASYVQDIAGGKPRPATPEGTSQGFVSPDGRLILVKASGGALVLYPVDGGEVRPVAGATPEDSTIRWSAEGRFLLVSRSGEVPAHVERLEVATGRREPLRTLGPADLTGVLSVGPFAFTDDGKSYAYACRRMVSHLFLVEGAR
jgi:hypothetical protein